MTARRAVALVVAALAVTACQSTPPTPVSDPVETTTFGATTVTTSGSVRVEGAYVD